MAVTVIFGPGYDQYPRAAVMKVMRKLGAFVKSRNWSVAGSQEIETMQAP